MNDLDELLRSFRSVTLDEPRRARIERAVAEQIRKSPPTRRRHRRPARQWIIGIAAIAGASVAIAVGINPFASNAPKPAEAFARELQSLATSGDVLHVTTTTHIFETSGKVDPVHLHIPGSAQSSRAEQWSTGNGLLKVEYVGRIRAVYTANRTEHASYLSNTHILTVARWASRTERADFLQEHRVFSVPSLLAAYRKGRVHLIGSTTWRGKRALRYEYRSAPDTMTYLVDPRTNHPLLLVDTYAAGGGGTFVVTQVYDTFERVPATAQNLAHLSFTPPTGTTVRHRTPTPYRPVSIGDGMRPKALALYRHLPSLETSSMGGRLVPSANRPIAIAARAIAVAQLPAGAGQWILYRAPRVKGGAPCYAFVDNRKDGLDARSGGWTCDAAGKMFSTLNPSPDLKTWELGGHITKPRVGQEPVARLILAVGGKPYPVQLLPNGFYLATAPATGDATVRRYDTSGKRVHAPVHANLKSFKSQIG